MSMKSSIDHREAVILTRRIASYFAPSAMKRSMPMPTRLCVDCGLVFILRNVRSTRCRPCQSMNIARQKLASQRKRHDARRINEQQGDISEAEVDRRFDAALKEIRRQHSESLEPFRSYGWLYREPRS